MNLTSQLYKRYFCKIMTRQIELFLRSFTDILYKLNSVIWRSFSFLIRSNVSQVSLALHWFIGSLVHWPSTGTGFLWPDFRLTRFLVFWTSSRSSASLQFLQFSIPCFCWQLQSHTSLVRHPKTTSFSIRMDITVIVVVSMDSASTESHEPTQLSCHIWLLTESQLSWKPV